jgi:hypothetical protein
MRPHQIGLGDVLRVLGTLDLAKQEQERAINLLGYCVQEGDETTLDRPVEEDSSIAPIEGSDSKPFTQVSPIGNRKNDGVTPDWLQSFKPVETEAAEVPPQPPETDARENEAWIYAVMRPARSPTPDWFRSVRPLEPDNESIEASAQPIESLFPPDGERMMLTSILSRPARRRDIDFSRLLQRMANLEVLSELPLRRRFSARGGVQVLLDKSKRMDPFAQDQRQLVDALCRLLPHERLQVLRCQSWPPDYAGQLMRRRNYRYPSRGTLVLLVSDLGQGGGLFAPHVSEPERWVDFARRLTARGCAFLVLAPVSPDRIDSRLWRDLEVIPWDRRVSVAVVRARHRRQGS